MLAGKQRIAGAIYQADLDLSHPLTFGLTRSTLPLFKNSTMLLQPSLKPFVNVALYSSNPQLAGYTAPEYVPRISQSAAMLAHDVGQGRVIAMTRVWTSATAPEIGCSWVAVSAPSSNATSA